MTLHKIYFPGFLRAENGRTHAQYFDAVSCHPIAEDDYWLDHWRLNGATLLTEGATLQAINASARIVADLHQMLTKPKLLK